MPTAAEKKLCDANAEADFNNNAKGSNPLANPGLDAPNYVHLVGSWTTLNYQISYEFGNQEEITPQTPKPGYDKEGNRLVGDQAISPKPAGSRWEWRSLLNSSKFIFGINNIFDTHAPLSVDSPYLGRTRTFSRAMGTLPLQRHRPLAGSSSNSEDSYLVPLGRRETQCAKSVTMIVLP
jgi:hypothetical protein